MRAHLVVYLLVLLAAAVTACADDSAIEGVGGVIAPMNEHPAIVMEKMLVDIHASPDHAAVTCEFVFHNTGKATAVRMGFPESGHSPGFEGEPSGFADFSTAVDGKPVKTHIEGLTLFGEGSWRRWRVKEVRFEADQTRTVTVSYAGGIGGDSLGGRFFEYPVSTGASWKEPIGHARVRLYLKGRPGFCPPSAPVRFRALRKGVYEWEARDFEPTRDDDISISFQPIHVEVKLGESGVGDRYLASRHLRAGTTMIPIEHLAGQLRVGLEREGSRLTLIRGGRTVVLHPGSRHYQVNGETRELPRAPTGKGSDVLVPLAAVARALGARVEYDGAARVVRAYFPRLTVFDGNLEPQTAHRARELLRNGSAFAPGWAPPDESDYDRDVLEYAQRHNLPAPWACFGDFNGDGAKDAAIILRRGDKLGVALIHTAASPGSFSLFWLQEPSVVGPTKPETIISLLQTRQPGLVEHWVEGETTQKSGRLDLKHDGIEVIAYEKAAVMYYWDEASQRYLRVITAD
jgi:hypothetical protein